MWFRCEKFIFKLHNPNPREYEILVYNYFENKLSGFFFFFKFNGSLSDFKINQ